MYGDCEIFKSKSKIPKLYLNAPKGQNIFQNVKSINILEKNNQVRSQSRSRYDERLSKLK